MKRGKIYESRTGRTRYSPTGYTKAPNGAVQIFVQGPHGFRALIRDGSVARRIRRTILAQHTSISAE
jgi:hypothetical protein